MANSKDKICAILKNKFKGRIDQARVYQVCSTERNHWLDGPMNSKHKGANQCSQSLATRDKELSQQDKTIF